MKGGINRTGDCSKVKLLCLKAFAQFGYYRQHNQGGKVLSEWTSSIKPCRSPVLLAHVLSRIYSQVRSQYTIACLHCLDTDNQRVGIWWLNDLQLRKVQYVLYALQIYCSFWRVMEEFPHSHQCFVHMFNSCSTISSLNTGKLK